MTDNLIDRRQFLHRAAGAVLVPTLMTSALAKCLSATPRSGWEAALWNGRRFVSPDHLANSSSPRGAVKVEIYGADPSGKLRGVDLKVPVIKGGERIVVPFHAWTANSPARTRFTAHAEEGLTFEILTKEGDEEVSLENVTPGTYVLARNAYDIDRVATCLGWRGAVNGARVPGHVVVTLSAV